MDRQGFGKEILLEDALQGLSFEAFQSTCVLIGCDYLPRLPRMGPKTAFRIVRHVHERWDGPQSLLEEVANRVQDAMPEDYPQGFAAACLLFRHQTVLDIGTGKCVPLMPLPAPLASDPPFELLGPPQQVSRIVTSVTEAIHGDENGSPHVAAPCPTPPSQCGAETNREDSTVHIAPELFEDNSAPV
eukprot:5186591-Amphidinium_carterae.1